MPVTMINRSNAEALIPVETSHEIIQNVALGSTVLRLAHRNPDMTRSQTEVPVLTGTVEAQCLNADDSLKPLSNLSWEKVDIKAAELAVIVPIPEAVLDDADYDIWAEVRPRIEEAFAKKIDLAILQGAGKPVNWPDGIIPQAVAAGNVLAHAANGDLYQNINGENGIIAMVEDDGNPVTGFVGSLKLRSKLRGAVAANRQPIFRSAYSNGAAGSMVYELNGCPIDFPRNGAMEGAATAQQGAPLLLAGNFDCVRYALRQDLTYKILTEASLTDADGKVILNLAQQDCVALRAVMRLGWALPKPLNAVSGVDYFPFSVLTGPAGA